MSRRLLDETKLLLLELFVPLVTAVSVVAADGAPDWSRNSWEAEDEVV